MPGDERRRLEAADVASLSRSIDSRVLLPLRLCDLVRGHLTERSHAFETVKACNIQQGVDFGLLRRSFEPAPKRGLLMSGSVSDTWDREAARLDQLNYGSERGAIVGFNSPPTSAEAPLPHVSYPNCPHRRLAKETSSFISAPAAHAVSASTQIAAGIVLLTFPGSR
jgi:hypothetical protein